MARLRDNFPFTGTISGCCIYKMADKHYLRAKSSLTGKRVKKDPAFHKTMENAGLFGVASKMASVVYRQLQKKDKAHTLYRQLIGKALCLLRDGKDREAIFVILQETCLRVAVKVAVTPVRRRVVLPNRLPPIWRCPGAHKKKQPAFIHGFSSVVQACYHYKNEKLE
ncbi:hypothetical protein [Chitinophaga niastensis]|nr:hypothetical protein [Chitinophaga niastensis]